ncbi:MAG: AIPR family protein [Saprospiraceae bacterium]
MKNRLVKGTLDEFKKDNLIENLDDSKAFEYLVNYLIISMVEPEAVYEDKTIIQEIDVDKTGTFGIDTIAIFINERLITSLEELIEVKENKFVKRIEPHFVFIQSKTSEKYETGDILKFITAVANLLSEEPDIPIEDELKFFRSVFRKLFEPEFIRLVDKPQITAYYAATGKPEYDGRILGIIRRGEKEIKASFQEAGDVKVQLLGSDFIVDTFKEIQRSASATIHFKNHLSLDYIEDVQQAYIGYISGREFLALIENEHGNIKKNIFYENVRAFQGEENPVNAGIAKSIKNSNLQNKFILLNNGVTVVTKRLQIIGGNKFDIDDFQIVNGCQTTSVFHKNKLSVSDLDSFFIPIKIIHTDNHELIGKIILATNKQTEIPDEAFLAINKFNKELQEYYQYIAKDMNLPYQLFYERRQREYYAENINKSYIISIYDQILSYNAIILGRPDFCYKRKSREIYKELTQKGNIFSLEHSPFPYFTSSYILFVIDKYFNNDLIPHQYRKYRYYLGYIYRSLIMKETKMKLGNKRQVELDCRGILNTINVNRDSENLFEEAIRVLENSQMVFKPSGKKRFYEEIRQNTSFRDTVEKEIGRAIR